MSQQSIFGRLGQLARVNVSALVDEAENPQAMLSQMIRDYSSAISDAESAVAQNIGNLRTMERDAREEQAAAAQWEAKATEASKTADEMRAAGDTAQADKFDNLARIALRRQIDSEDDAKNLATAIADECDVMERLKDGLNEMRQRLAELGRKRHDLVRQAKSVQVQTRMRDSIRSIDILDPTSEISRFEEKIRREEARIRGRQELSESVLDAEFEDSARQFADAEVEARLNQLKSGAPSGSI